MIFTYEFVSNLHTGYGVAEKHRVRAWLRSGRDDVRRWDNVSVPFSCCTYVSLYRNIAG